MTMEEERPLADNPPGANLYLPDRLVNDTVCPLDPGSRVQVITIPHTGLVILPDTANRPFPPLHDPDRDQTNQPTQSPESDI